MTASVARNGGETRGRHTDRVSLRIVVDDLSAPETRRLIAAHLDGMHAQSPPESVHALDLTGLSGADVTVWSAWREDELVGVGALRRLDPENAELKSMRVDDRFLGTGAGRAILRHVVAEAAARGVRTLWLETGVEEGFLPARRLYESEGFAPCAPFGDYDADPLSVFMTRTL